jgi:hypothetical protein
MCLNGEIVIGHASWYVKRAMLFQNARESCPTFLLCAAVLSVLVAAKEHTFLDTTTYKRGK